MNAQLIKERIQRSTLVVDGSHSAPKKVTRIIRGRFFNREMAVSDLQSAKDRARRVIRRNKRLGDLLGQ